MISSVGIPLLVGLMVSTSLDIPPPSKADEQASSNNRQGQRAPFWMLLLLIVAMAGVSYTTLAFNRPKFARSEISYAEQSREMIVRNTFVTPSYHYVPCIDKPAMIYWMIIPGFKMLGTHAFAARIPAILFALFCLAFVAISMRSVCGWQTALVSAMVLATANRFLEFASLCMTDIFLTSFDAVTVAALYAATVNEKRRTSFFLVAAVSSGLAVLTKGPVGLALPAILFAVYLCATRQLSILKNGKLILAGLLFLAVAAPWYLVAAYKVQGPQYFLQWLWHHNVDRFAGEAYAYNYPPWYMLSSFFLGFAPWSLLVPFALVGLVRQWRKNENPQLCRLQLYLWLWVGLTTLFFTISKGKMNYYDLPAFPAAAAAVAVQLTAWIGARQKTASFMGWLLAAVCTVGGVVACFFMPHITGNASVLDWLLTPLALFIPGVMMLISMRRKQYFRAFALAGAAILLATTAFSLQGLPAIGRQIPALDYLEVLRTTPADAVIGLHTDFAKTVDWTDHTLFATGRIPSELSSTAATADFLTQPKLAYLIIPKDRFDELPAAVKLRTTVLADKPYISDKLDLKFLLKRQGNLTGRVPLLLVTNKQ